MKGTADDGQETFPVRPLDIACSAARTLQLVPVHHRFALDVRFNCSGFGVGLGVLGVRLRVSVSGFGL